MRIDPQLWLNRNTRNGQPLFDDVDNIQYQFNTTTFKMSFVSGSSSYFYIPDSLAKSRQVNILCNI